MSKMKKVETDVYGGLRHVKWSPGWLELGVVGLDRKKNYAAVLGYNPDVDYAFCVSFCGSGQYFQNLWAAEDYCRERGWNYDAVWELWQSYVESLDQISDPT